MPEKSHWTPARGRRLKALFTTIPFPRFLGMTLEKLAAGEARVALPAARELRQYQGIVHGGALAALADTAATFAAMTLLPEDTDLVTIEFKINFLRAADRGRTFAHGSILRMGSRISVAEVQLFGRNRRQLLSTGTFTMLNFHSESAPTAPKRRRSRKS